MGFEKQLEEMSAKMVERANQDEAFRELCKTDYWAAVKQITGIEVAGEWTEEQVAYASSDELTDDQLEAVSGGVTSGISTEQLNAMGGVSGMDLAGMDIETALMAVQSQRTQLLDEQLKNQIQAVQEKNNQAAQLNDQLSQLNGQERTPENQAQIDAVKSQLDGLQNSQQMDMLRLQSMSNKRNEAFDVMTDFVKKMQDSRSSIIGNMR